MAEQFELPVEYKGEEYFFKAVLVVYGFTHKFHVDVGGQTIIFEPDEERNYRAVGHYEEIETHRNIDIELIKAITKSIEGIVK